MSTSTKPSSPVRYVVPSALAWLLLVVAGALGAVSVPLVDAIALLGVAVVLPLALGGPMIAWAVSATALFAGFQVPAGVPAALLVTPLAATVAAVAIVAWTRARSGPRVQAWSIDRGVDVLAGAYALVAVSALIASRLGAEPLGIREPIVELTAVHFTYAGVAALVLARQALAGATGHWIPAARTAVGATAAAPLLVAVGFVTGSAWPQVGGALVMTLGVWLTATLELRAAATRPHRFGSVLLWVSGLAIWVPMVLAVAWASGQHWDVPALSIPDMARTHGLVNALAFVLCGLVGGQLARPAADPGVGVGS